MDEAAAWLESPGNWRALASIAVVLGVIVATYLARRELLRRVTAMDAPPTTERRFLEAAARALHPAIVLVVALELGGRVLDLPEPARRVLDVVHVVAVPVLIGLVASAGVRAAIDHWAAERRGQSGAATLAAGLSFVGRTLVWTLVFLVVLGSFGIEVDAIVTGLGVGGVAVAFAVQNVLSDLFASLAIYFDRPFDIGDYVSVGSGTDAAAGTVERIGLRSTRLRGPGGEELVMSNADLGGSRIRNFRRIRERRVVLTIGISYATPADRVERAVGLVREAIASVEGLRVDRVHVTGFGPSSLLFEAVYWLDNVEHAEHLDRQQAVLFGILRRFAAEGIALAIPTQAIELTSVPPALVDALRPR